MRGALEGRLGGHCRRLPSAKVRCAVSIEHSQQTGKDIPFIVVSGAIGEETAVSIMKSGAHDYLLKDRWRDLLRQWLVKSVRPEAPAAAAS